MNGIKVVSFDLEGTLATPDFSDAVWHEGIPRLYAAKYGLALADAKSAVFARYREVGEQNRDWYDIGYWFRLFQLGDYRMLLDEQRHRSSCYTDAGVLRSLKEKGYVLVISTNTAREFLPYLLDGIGHHFARIFSAISDYGCLKSPSFFHTMCREMGVSPQETVHIGDSWEFDFIPATESGITAFHLDRSGKPVKSQSLTGLTELDAVLERRK